MYVLSLNINDHLLEKNFFPVNVPKLAMIRDCGIDL